MFIVCCALRFYFGGKSQNQWHWPISYLNMEKKDAVGPVAPPPGLQSIINECLKIYPDQPNPLQVATVVKYW